jgi:hypothetical protein
MKHPSDFTCLSFHSQWWTKILQPLPSRPGEKKLESTLTIILFIYYLLFII